MNTAKRYRCRQTGKLLVYGDLNQRADVTRFKPAPVPNKKKPGEMLQPKIFHISVAAEPNLDQYAFDVCDVDPVFEGAKPSIDPYIEELRLKGAKKNTDDEWVEDWVVVDLFKNTDELKSMLIHKIGTLAKTKRDGGTVTTGSIDESYSHEDDADWDCTIDNSTSTGRVRVTGEASNTIDWGGVVTRREVTPA